MSFYQTKLLVFESFSNIRFFTFTAVVRCHSICRQWCSQERDILYIFTDRSLKAHKNGASTFFSVIGRSLTEFF